VSANGKSVAAHPADWGPNIATGRIADLSPGLADALGLDTDSDCTLEIPLPAEVSIPIPATGPAVGVDLAAIDATKFPLDVTRMLVVMTTSDQTTHWVVNLTGQDEGGQTLMRQVANNPPELLRSNTVILPIKADAQISTAVAAELNKAIRKEPDVPTGPAGPAPGPGDDLSARVFTTAESFVGHDTGHVPGTENGNLACAWAVNEVVRRALGKPISTDEQGRNGLDTGGMFSTLQRHHSRLPSAKLGAIIISPTPPNGNVHGHVGIVGQNPGGGVDNTQIFSNSSRDKKFEQNRTIKSWLAHYSEELNLPVLFFELNRDRF